MCSKTFTGGGGDIDFLLNIYEFKMLKIPTYSKQGKVASKIKRQKRYRSQKSRKRATEARSNTYLNMQVAYFVKNKVYRYQYRTENCKKIFGTFSRTSVGKKLSTYNLTPIYRKTEIQALIRYTGT
jgi:hypothetical protein